MPIKTTVVCHFFNEEVYLPVWLKHHVRLFDHGVLIDYRSTDRSRQIIQELAPTWDVVMTKNDMFETYAIDSEVMEIERAIDGWKVALNVTEFLITDDLKASIEAFERQHPSSLGFVTVGCLIIESPEQKDQVTILEDKIWEQFHFGIVQKPQSGDDPIPIQRARLIHKAKDGRYGPGRHSNGVSQLVWPLFLFWYGWCPLYLKKIRNEMVRPRIPQENLKRNWGTHHILDDGKVEAVWRSYLKHCKDVLDGRHPTLNAAFERLSKRSV
jgi:hypothetical protein